MGEGPRTRQDTDESHSGEENQNCDALSESDTASVMWQGSEVSTDDIPVPLSEPDVDVRGAHAGSPEIRAAFVFLDTIDLRTTFARRASVMKSIPQWLKGPFRNALKMAMEEAIRPGVLHQERGWKLFLLIPRLLLHRPPRGGLVPKSKLVQRFDDFARGYWEKLFQSEKCDEEASRACTRKRRRQKPEDDITRRAARALALAQKGELSAGRQALEGADLAPGTMETLRELRDPVRRPARIRQPLPPQVADHMPDRPFELEEYRFAQVLRSSRKGAAAGPSGMTADHLRPVLENRRDTHLLFTLGEKLARAEIPDSIVEAIRLGRLTALQKPSGGVRGIVAGDILRRIVARTIAQQISSHVERTTAPFQYAMSTRAGTECIAHVLQALTELDPRATIMSIDGVGAFDLISRKSTLEAPMEMESGSQVLPFVSMFYGAIQCTSGRTKQAWCTRSNREREANKVMCSCRSCTLSGNTQP